MKIFYYTWYENSEKDIAESLVKAGHDVVKCHISFANYEEDTLFCENLERLFLEHSCELFFSFNFFPLIAKVAEKLQKRYISWVYDCPHNTLYSPAILSKYVSVFAFDKAQYYWLQSVKSEQVYHMPLAVNTERLNALLGCELSDTTYKYDVSFVGSLYEKNLYRQINYLPEYLRGYIQGVVAAQQKIYGYNLVGDSLTDEVFEEIRRCVVMNLDESYLADGRQLYLDMINAEVTHQERVALLNAAADYFDVTLFSASEPALVPQIVCGGTVSYETEMPRVFRESKINLNITLRSITSGISLRALDIMGAGGFLLTNYQPEIAEYFVDGEEVVMFESKDDMLNKIAYYLEHEDERKQIAYNGWLKVQREFSYASQLDKIFRMI